MNSNASNSTQNNQKVSQNLQFKKISAFALESPKSHESATKMVQMQSDLNFSEVKALFPNLSDSEINKILEDSGSSS